METKKNRDKSTEQLRIPLLFSGLLFTGGLLLASFTYSTTIQEDSKQITNVRMNEVAYEQNEDEATEQETESMKDDDYVAPPQPVVVIVPPSPKPPKPGPPRPPLPPGPPKPPTPPLPEIIDFPDVEAEFIGGTSEMMRWIGSNVVYPDISIQLEEQGKVYISFVVEVDGSLSNITIEKGVSKDLDREAKRLARAMPNWKPGEAGGKKVRTRCRLPIIFTLE